MSILPHKSMLKKQKKKRELDVNEFATRELRKSFCFVGGASERETTKARMW